MNPNYMMLARMLAILVLVIHWMACGYWVIVANFAQDPYGREVHCLKRYGVNWAYDAELQLYEERHGGGHDGRGGGDGSDGLGGDTGLADSSSHDDTGLCEVTGVGGDDEMWMPPYFIRNAGLDEQYAYAFFWSISVTTGAGWDVVPATIPEVVYSSVMVS
jgi:hypothetical protein